MRSHRFIKSLLYLVIQLVAKESKAKENNAVIRCLFALFLEKRYISQVIYFKSLNLPLFVGAPGTPSIFFAFNPRNQISGKSRISACSKVVSLSTYIFRDAKEKKLFCLKANK